MFSKSHSCVKYKMLLIFLYIGKKKIKGKNKENALCLNVPLYCVLCQFFHFILLINKDNGKRNSYSNASILTFPEPEVDCSESGMTVYIPRTIIGEALAYHLHFQDPTCVGSYHNSTHVKIFTTYDRCGTFKEVYMYWICIK